MFRNCSDFITNTWSMKNIKTRDRSVLHTQMDIMQLFLLYILQRFNVYRYANDCASRVMQLCASQLIIYSGNESFFWPRFVVYIFPYGSKTVLYSFTETWRDIYGYIYSELVGMFVYCVNMCRLCIIAWDYSAVPYCTIKTWSVHPFIRTS